MRTLAVAVTSLLTVVLLQACSSDEPRPEVIVTRTVTATPSPTDGPRPGATGPAITLEGQGSRFFQTPSRNIGCFLTAYPDESRVECTVRERAYADPEKPEDCDLAWIPQFTLTSQASYGACRGDVNNPLPAVVLAYGSTAVSRAITCTSEESGLTCRNEDTDHGFTISRARYELF